MGSTLLRSKNQHLILSGKILLLALIYFLTARFGLSYAMNRFATIVWPPSGIAVAAMLIFGRQIWPGIFLGATIANYSVGAYLPSAAGIGLGNTLESFVAWYCCLRLSGLNLSLERRRDATQLIFFAAILSSLVSATFGVSSLFLGALLAQDQVLITWLQWWTGDCIGILTLTPLFLVFRKPFSLKPNWPRIAEAALLILLLASFLAIVFLDALNFGYAYQLEVQFLYPMLLWASIRFGVRGGTLATLVISGTAIWATAHGFGPFVFGTRAAQLIAVSVFVIGVAMIDLIVASFVTELSLALGGRDLFFSMISHELKTPITSLKLQTQLLLRDLERKKSIEPRELAETLGSSLRLIGSLQDLVDDLLDVSRVRTGHFSLHREPVNLSELVRQIATRFASRLRDCGCELTLDLKAETPGLWDRRRLEQVLVNLISNAAKYAPNGPLIIRTALLADHVLLSVEDRGPGIELHQQRKIFDRFERLNASSANDGLGLGLYIVKVIVEAHHGTIDLESESGKGAKFNVRLPLQSA